MTDPAPWFSLPKPPALAPAPVHTTSTVLIVGAGLAGCWLARTLAEHGIKSTVLDSDDVASGASGNHVGVVKPYVTRRPGFAEYFYASAFACLMQRLNDWGLRERCGFEPCGVMQLCHAPYPDRESYLSVSPTETSECVGMEINSYGLWFADSGYLAPRSLCHVLLEHALIDVLVHSEVSLIDVNDESATATLADNRSLQADIIVLATGSSLRELAPTRHLPIIPARGQTSNFRCDKSCDVPRAVVSGRHYVIPGHGSVTVGASFLRDDIGTELRPQEHASNLRGLRKMLPGLRIDPTPTDGQAGVRATTPDRLPLVGPVPDPVATAEAYRDLHHGRPHEHYPELPTVPRLMVLGGFGSRGIVTTAFCAQLLANYLIDVETSDESLESYASLINPVRFQIRELRRRQ